MQRLFERAVNHKQTRQSPLLWRCYLAYELHRGRPESARRIMLRAVHACTWCKALWLDGIQALAHQVSEVQELWAGRHRGLGFLSTPAPDARRCG